MKWSEERFLIQLISFLAIFLLLILVISFIGQLSDILMLFSLYLGIVFLGVELWRVIDVFKDGVGRYWTYLKPPHPEIEDQIGEYEGLISFIQTLIPDRQHIEFSEISPKPIRSSFFVGTTLIIAGISIFLLLGLTIAGLEQYDLIENILPTDESSVSTSFAALAVLLGRVFGIMALAIELALSELNTGLVTFFLLLFGIPTIFIAPGLRNFIFCVEETHLVLVKVVQQRQSVVSRASWILLAIAIFYAIISGIFVYFN